MGTPPLRILIVDDSPEDRETYRRLLLQDRERSYEFLETGSGEEGLALVRTARPDCLLLDYRLPDLDGLEFLGRLAATGEAGPVPVIVLTGQGNEAVAVEAMKNGAQDYLLKGSMSRDDLERAVQNAIEKVALRRKIDERTAELQHANGELQREIAERERAEGALQRMYGELEQIVHQRTAELSRANVELKREIGERQRAEEERNLLLVREQEARRQAEEANQLKDEFLATLSHELRTPLSAMLGWAQMLRTGKLDAATAERALETIERNARAQAQLISDLLDVSRIITGKLRLDLRPVELPRILDAALESLRPAADAKAILLVVRIVPPSTAVLGDADRLQQVVWNLVSNAVKFTPRGGRVEVLLEDVPPHVEFRVIDTGIGIRPDFLPHVFDRFRQAESSLTRAHGGLGLGLSIVRHLVELHGGSVAVASAGEGQGATFAVRLPAWTDLSAAAVTSAPRAADEVRVWDRPTLLAGVHVLALEDEADTRDLLVAALGRCGARVTAVSSVVAAIAVLDRSLPDVLLSDIGVPGEDGYSLIRQVRSREPARGGAIPAAALTAYARHEDRLRALASGFQLHLAKPIDPAELVAIIARLVGRNAAA
jgi:signal transduction histidine kinase